MWTCRGDDSRYRFQVINLDLEKNMMYLCHGTYHGVSLC